MVHRVTSQRVRRFVGECALRLNVVHEPRVPMDPDLRRRLQREAAPDVDQLSKLLDRDLSGWYRDLAPLSGHRRDALPGSL